ncbi:MAG: indole-3-glycerol phosphate synthase TrpC [Candidatus Omnitrophica bacterium]|nr:indole-3-glycerol phosphate synthase TrpC [Candidatus Omnitrophota bacterium]
MVLNEILERKREEVETLKRRIPLSKMRAMIDKSNGSRRAFGAALAKKHKLHLICEMKKASPSEGLLRARFEPKILAQEFEAAGASAISVLTERHFFQGSPETLKQIRPFTTIPILRKDFIVDSFQVYETVLLGADAFLVIALLLTEAELKQMIRLAQALSLDVLVEVHTKEELDKALSTGATIIGINNRSLETLQIDLSVSEHLLRFIPKGTVAVIESGIETRQQIDRYRSMGVHCFLIGTSLMKAQDIKAKILELSGNQMERT